MRKNTEPRTSRGKNDKSVLGDADDDDNDDDDDDVDDVDDVDDEDDTVIVILRVSLQPESVDLVFLVDELLCLAFGAIV